MMEAIKEVLVALTMYAMCLFILPVLMHKALYTFAKITYKIHKLKINAKKYERFERVLERRMVNA